MSKPVKNARELLALTHPLHEVLVKWCKTNPPTLRKARAFLATYPQFRG